MVNLLVRRVVLDAADVDDPIPAWALEEDEAEPDYEAMYDAFYGR